MVRSAPLIVRTWFIVTPEYPPDAGGIGDYIALVAGRLAARGDRVHVFTRSPPNRAHTPGVDVVLLPDDFGPATERRLAAAMLGAPSRAVLLVQYVPQGFRKRGMNVAFAAWLRRRSERRFVMVHEAVYPFSVHDRPVRWILAGATRVMLHLVASGAERVFISTPVWERFTDFWGKKERPAEWLPIPATLDANPVDLLDGQPSDPDQSREVVCHFGTYGKLVADLVEPLLESVLARRPSLELVLLGRGAENFGKRLAARTPSLQPRIHFAGPSPAEIARELARATLVVLPFIEGATTRRTTLMNALAVGAAIVTTDGGGTEDVWRASGAVSLYPSARPDLALETIERLLNDPALRRNQRAAALALYAERFHLDRIVDRLQASYDATNVRDA